MSMPDLSRFGAVLTGVSGSDTELRDIPLTEIAENPKNFYPPISWEETLALADSIQANGLLEPLVVVPAGEQYRLISGHNRFRALRYLCVNGDGKAYTTALCRVLPPMDEAKELAAIIEFNRQRKKTPGILAEEARRLEKSYRKRRDAGENLPGRIRDRIAADLGVSPAKLGNISAIERGLAEPELMDAWKGGELPESLALRLARLDPTEQSDFVAWVEEDPVGRDLTGPDLDRFLAGDEEPAAEPAEAEDRDESEEKNEDVPDWQREREAFAARLRAAREATGLDKAAFAEKIGAYKATYSAWENGDLPGSGRFPELARALGVTTDYLYGLTDDPHGSGSPPEPPEQQLVLAGWMPGGVDPSEPGLFAAVLDLDGKTIKRLLRWQGGKWVFEHITSEINVPVLWWLRLPPVPGEEGAT